MFYKEKAYTRINWKNRPNLSTPLGAKNLNKMDEAIEELDERVVETSIEAEKNRLSVQNLGLEIESVSKDIEEVRESTQYIDSSKIVTNKSGSPVYMDDASNMNIENIVFYGESKQETTTGKNFIQYPYADGTSKVQSGVTYKVNADKSITANGTASALSQFYTTRDLEMELKPNTTYILSGCPKGGTLQTYRLRAIMNWQITGTKTAIDYGDGVTFTTPNEYTHIRIMVDVEQGVTVNNLVFKPMIRLATVTDATYEPYTGGKPAPNPDYPQMIESSSVGSVRVYRKNLLNNTAQSRTDAGLTYTVNNDKSVTVNGTATGLSIVKVGAFKNTDRDLILSGCPKGGNTNTYKLSYYHETTQVNDFGSGVTLPKNDLTYEVRIVIYGGTTINNLTFKPMIRPTFFTDGTYEPYESQFASLTSSMYFLDGIGNIRDTIEIDANGNGKYIQRIGKIYTKNVSVVYSSSYTNPNGNVFIVAFSSWEKEILWTHRNKGQSVSTLTKDQYYVGQNENSASGKVIYFISDATTTASALAEIKAENSEIYYILLEPIETALSQADIDAIKALHTYKPNTIVDAQDTLIDVQFVADTKAYIDNKFRELATVIVNQ